MMDDTTEAGTLCRCNHPAVSHINPALGDERCREPECGCLAFRPHDPGCPAIADDDSDMGLDDYGRCVCDP